MSMAGYLLIDGNSLSHAAVATRTLKVGNLPTNATYGVLRTIRAMVGVYPILTPVVLWDGATWRKEFFKEYKGSREAEATDDKPLTKAQVESQERRASLKLQKPYIRLGLKLLGVTQMWANNLEADDLAGMLVKRYQPKGKKIMMVTGDKDWIQLVGPGVGWREHRTEDRVTMKNFKDFTGVADGRQWLEVKALMGDISDEIPGVGGIGEKGAVELINTYGSVASFINQVNDGSLKKLPKKFMDLATDGEKQANFTRNMRLMDLNSPDIPPPSDLRVTTAAMDAAKYERFCRELAFHSMLTDLPGWVKPFERIHR